MNPPALVFWYMLHLVCLLQSLYYQSCFDIILLKTVHSTIQYNWEVQQPKRWQNYLCLYLRYFAILAALHARCQSYRRHLAIISAPSLFPRNHIGAAFRFAKKCICSNCRMYLSKLKNVFVQVCPPAITSAPPSDLLQKVTLTYRKNPSMVMHLYTDLPYSEESVKMHGGQKLDIFPSKHLRLHLFFYFHLHFSFSFLGVHCTWVETYCPSNYPSTRHIPPPEGTLHPGL